MAVRIEEFRLPRYRDIPDVGLYLDQTVKYINRFLEPLGCMGITASMVSNYVKKGYITSPKHKQYDAEQIAYLFFIAIAKNVLSMEHIARLMDAQKRVYPPEVAYNYFCDELENLLLYTFGAKDEVEELGKTQTETKTMLRTVLIALVHIIYLNHLFDTQGEHIAEEADAEMKEKTTQE